MQTLGTLVQSYASMLAILGAFYVFFIEKNKLESNYLFQELGPLYYFAVKAPIDQKMGIFDPFTDAKIDSYKDIIINNGNEKLDELITKELGRRKSEYLEITKSDEYIKFINKVEEYKNKDKYIKKWSKNLFLPVATLYIIVIILSLFIMSSIAYLGNLYWITPFYIIIMAVGIAGFITFIGLLVSVYRLK